MANQEYPRREIVDPATGYTIKPNSDGSISAGGYAGTLVFKTVAAVAAVAGTGATIWTPAAGKKVRLLGWSLSSSANASLIFGDNTVGAVILRTELLAAAGVSQSPPGLGTGFLSAAADNVLKLDVTANSTVSGFVFGIEV
ncbi:MAG: hypothetical protein H0V07_06225 [Propionibacteriales bacterium]|nr:hypothetical protein [Propionibacteriales bacterium]